jgi:predicted alpha/beta-hydrolase family hydrolase
MAVLERTYRSAIAMLGRDPSAAPAHLFLGGTGLGAKVAAQIARSRVRIEGAFFLGYPLHSQDKPETVQAEALYRIIAPMLFVQGTRDRRCDIGALRAVLSRVGAPTTLHIAQEADQGFRVPKRSGRNDEEMRAELLESLATWIYKVLNSDRA